MFFKAKYMENDMVRKIIFLITGVLFLSLTSVSAQDTEFRRVELPYGILLDIPSHWVVLSQDTRKNIRAAGEVMIENTGIDVSDYKKETLLAVNSIPEPTGAMIRVSISFSSDITQTDLMGASSADLKEVGDEMLQMFRNLEASGGPKLIEMQEVRIEKIDNNLTLVIPYIRESKIEKSSWQVTLYKIPLSNQIIELTLSHRQSDALLWKPILEKVKRSLKLKNDGTIQNGAKKGIPSKNQSAMEYLYGPLWWLTIIVSFILTWGIGLIPPLVIRYVIIRKPLSKAWAIGTTVFLWIINVGIFTAIGSKSKTHAALFFVAWVSYIILRRKQKV
jgi:hypothetical protein